MPFATRERAREYQRDWRRKGREEQSAAYLAELAANRANKERYRGTCRECGASTSGANGPGSASELCCRCSARAVAKAKRGAGFRQRELLALLTEHGPMRYSAIGNAMGFPRPTDVGELLHRARKYGFVVRVSRGVYGLAPTSATAADAASQEVQS